MAANISSITRNSSPSDGLISALYSRSEINTLLNSDNFDYHRTLEELKSTQSLLDDLGTSTKQWTGATQSKKNPAVAGNKKTQKKSAKQNPKTYDSIDPFDLPSTFKVAFWRTTHDSRPAGVPEPIQRPFVVTKPKSTRTTQHDTIEWNTKTAKPNNFTQQAAVAPAHTINVFPRRTSIRPPELYFNSSPKPPPEVSRTPRVPKSADMALQTLPEKVDKGVEAKESVPASASVQTSPELMDQSVQLDNIKILGPATIKTTSSVQTAPETHNQASQSQTLPTYFDVVDILPEPAQTQTRMPSFMQDADPSQWEQRALESILTQLFSKQSTQQARTYRLEEPQVVSEGPETSDPQIESMIKDLIVEELRRKNAVKDTQPKLGQVFAERKINKPQLEESETIILFSDTDTGNLHVPSVRPTRDTATQPDDLQTRDIQTQKDMPATDAQVQATSTESQSVQVSVEPISAGVQTTAAVPQPVRATVSTQATSLDEKSIQTSFEISSWSEQKTATQTAATFDRNQQDEESPVDEEDEDLGEELDLGEQEEIILEKTSPPVEVATQQLIAEPVAEKLVDTKPQSTFALHPLSEANIPAPASVLPVLDETSSETSFDSDSSSSLSEGEIGRIGFFSEGEVMILPDKNTKTKIPVQMDHLSPTVVGRETPLESDSESDEETFSVHYANLQPIEYSEGEVPTIYSGVGSWNAQEDGNLSTGETTHHLEVSNI